jgi:hypothetical protein
MTNTQIIYETAKAHGFTDAQLEQLMTACHGDLPLHTLPEWSRMGYHVKAGEKALFSCDLWKHTNKAPRTARDAAEDSEGVPECPHFYKKLSYIFGLNQVERNTPAPDLDTIKARLGSLPGLTLTVKGAQTSSPVVWLTGDTAAHANAIQAAGGIWSNKKQAYYIKPSTAPAADPAPEQTQPAADLPPVHLALPAPAQLLALPEHKTDPEPAPAPVPGSWKKRSFYTIRREKGEQHPSAHKADGYTDGIFNYYATGKVWHAIHPVYGLSIVMCNSRKDAQREALDNWQKLQDALNKNPRNDRMSKCAAMIQAAENGDNLTIENF